MQTLRDAAIHHLGIPYRFGGKCPVGGLDCSGFVSELLKGCGIIPHVAQWNAQDIYDNLEKGGVHDRWGLGSLAFYGKDPRTIDHVAFCLDQFRMIEAGGGDALTKTIDDAIAKNACVRIRPIKYRFDFLFVLKPDYSKIGVT